MSLALGLGISPVLGGKSLGVAAASLADQLAGAETNVLAMSFIDLSTRIRDTVTPANNYTGSPFGKLSVTRASIGTYFDAAGVLQTASANQPRLDHHPNTLANMGVTIEPAATNLVLQSQDFTQAVWTKTNGTNTAGAITGLDGTASGSRLVANNGAIGNYNQSITLAAATQYAVWGFFKTDGNQVSTQIVVPAAAFTDAIDHIVQFNLQTGAFIVVQGAATIGFMLPLSNGWYRCGALITANNAGAVAVQFLKNTANGNGVNGNYCCGCQIEAGPSYTSYIPTVAATVTRLADQINMATSLFNWSNTQCMIYSQATQRATLDGVTKSAITVGDGTVNNRNTITQGRGADDFSLAAIQVASVSQNNALITSNPSLAYQLDKIAVSYIVGTALSAKNGNAGTPGAPASLPSACTILILGAQNTAGNTGPLKGWVAALMVLPITKTQPQLNALTT